jgi:hypothetical protein
MLLFGFTIVNWETYKKCIPDMFPKCTQQLRLRRLYSYIGYDFRAPAGCGDPMGAPDDVSQRGVAPRVSSVSQKFLQLLRLLCPATTEDPVSYNPP